MDYLNEEYSGKNPTSSKRSNSVINVKRKHSFVSLTKRTFGSGSHSANASPQKSETPKSPKSEKKLKNLVREERANSKWYAYTPVPFRPDEKTVSHVDLPKVTCDGTAARNQCTRTSCLRDHVIFQSCCSLQINRFWNAIISMKLDKSKLGKHMLGLKIHI